MQWYTALKQVFPIYLATHLAFLLLTYTATLFTVGNFSSKVLRVHTLLDSWYRWDTGRYIHIATFGYDQSWTFAFFPLYPLLEKGGAFLTHDPFVAGLLISNLAGLGLLVVLYRLVEHDFDAEHAWRTALYLAVFPTAFFLTTAYNESLFLLLTVLSFSFMRQANWWLAGLCGLLAALTLSVGLLLFVPFCYEYLRQHRFHLRALRVDLLAGVLIPAGLGLYALYGFLQFHDALAFSHAESLWNRRLQVPWYAFLEALHQIRHNHLLSFISIHNVLDLSACLFILVLLVLCWVGPWKFSREQRAYSIYAAGLYGWLLLFPTLGNTPLASYSRLYARSVSGVHRAGSHRPKATTQSLLSHPLRHPALFPPPAIFDGTLDGVTLEKDLLNYYWAAFSVAHSIPQGAWTTSLITVRVSPLLESSSVMPFVGSTP